jgi:hypothetical protein
LLPLRFGLLRAKVNATHYIDNDGYLAWRSLGSAAIDIERTTRKLTAPLAGELFGLAL